MSDPDTKEKHSRKYRRNMVAKALRDNGELKGAFSMKVIDGRKQEYKRKRIDIKNIEGFEDDE